MDPTDTCDLPPQAGRYDYACLGRVWALSLKNNPLPHFFFFFKELSALEKENSNIPGDWIRGRRKVKCKYSPMRSRTPLVGPGLTQMFYIFIELGMFSKAFSMEFNQSSQILHWT